MKSAQKGIEMKLIQILALAIAMATVATAQNSGANSQPTPSPTPAAAGKTAGTKKPAAKKAASGDQKTGAKASPGTSAKTSSNNAASPKADPQPKSGSASSATGKPAVKTTTEPAKAKTTAGTQSKSAPTPVVAAKDGKNSSAAKNTGTKKAETKKADTRKADTRKAPPAKAPAVIAVKPVAPVKKAPGTQRKTSAKSSVQVPAKAPAPGTAQKVTAAQTAEKPKPSVRAFGAHGRRDPFVSPIVSKDGISRPAPNCTSGKRCLVIPELVLQGTVKDTSGKMMAVVANSIKKTYFLRENDQVFQGSVEKITSDSIIFREFVKDALGRETAREVVKKLVPPS
jgi:Tfp pilus assembly protein PilP